MSIRHRHDMPFGATLVEGGIRFRLWAPRASSVTLLLYEGGAPNAQQMTAQPDGWYELTTNAAHAGTRYKFRIDGGVEVPDPAARARARRATRI